MRFPTRPTTRQLTAKSILAAALTAAVFAQPALAAASPSPAPGSPSPARPAAQAAAAVTAPRVAVNTLDPSLYRPHPGDSAAVAAIRVKLAKLAAANEAAGQEYNKAADTERQTARDLVTAKQVQTAADAADATALRQLQFMVTTEYQTYSPLASISTLFTARDQVSLAQKLEAMRMLSMTKASIANAAAAAKDAAAAAAARVAALQAQAADAVTAARAARDAATKAVLDGQTLLATTQAAELAAALRAAATGAITGGSGTPADAAITLRAQALATGAAQPKDFLGVTNAAAVISVAARALLRQAAGLGPAPHRTPALGAAGSVPAFAPAVGAPTDTTAVMGPAANLGGIGQYPAATGTGVVSRSLTLFRNDPAPAQPSPGSDPGPVAPTLKADGVNVHPTLPPLGPGRHLRAEIAVNVALSEIGSPYVWAASGPAAFDCSGLTQWAWGAAGVSLGHFTGTQINQGVRVTVNELLPGDLILFGADLHHVGMYLGAGYMIDAPHTGAYVRVEKVAPFGDFTAAVRP